MALYDFTIAIKVQAEDEEEAIEKLDGIIESGISYDVCDIREVKRPPGKRVGKGGK